MPRPIHSRVPLKIVFGSFCKQKNRPVKLFRMHIQNILSIRSRALLPLHTRTIAVYVTEGVSVGERKWCSTIGPRKKRRRIKYFVSFCFESALLMDRLFRVFFGYFSQYLLSSLSLSLMLSNHILGEKLNYYCHCFV